MNLNLHDIVRGAITSVNEDVAGTIYVSTGRTNVRGILTPTFTAVPAQLQVQAKQHSALELLADRGVGQQDALFTIYAYGQFGDLSRPDGKGGDMANFNGQWWRITQVLEWWPLWCSFEVTRQLNAADLNALLAELQNGAPV